MVTSDWQTSVTKCDDWNVAAVIPQENRNFYEVYRISVPYTSLPGSGNTCCKITEMELTGTDDSSWIDTYITVQAGTSSYTSPTATNLFVLEPSTPSLTDDPDGQQLQVNEEAPEESYSVTLHGQGFPCVFSLSFIYFFLHPPTHTYIHTYIHTLVRLTRHTQHRYIQDVNSSNRVVVHIMQEMTPSKCCSVNNWVTGDGNLDTMRNRLKTMDRYISGTESNTNDTSLTCDTASTNTTITCYFGTSEDDWTNSDASNSVTCPCKCKVLSSSNDPGVNSTMIVTLQSGWYHIGATSATTFNIETFLYYFLDVQGTNYLSDTAVMVTVQGEPQVVEADDAYTTNLAVLTINGNYFSSTAIKNTVTFRCTEPGDCGHTSNYGCQGDITGQVVGASTDGKVLKFQIWKFGYYNGCIGSTGSQIEVQVSVEGITSSSEWKTIGYFTSVAPEISNDSLPILSSDYPYITVSGYGFAVQSSSDAGNETVQVIGIDSNLTLSYENTITAMYQGGGASTYTTDAGDSTTLPTLVGSIVSSSRSGLVLSFTSLSPLNQDSIQSGNVKMSIQTTYVLIFVYFSRVWLVS
jgi:hypothetical protein